MSDEEDDSFVGDLTCRWGECALEFESSELLDGHVETAHIKGARKAQKKDEKGMVCEWKACETEKIFRDSWNLVTHMRYKHTHYKPFACSQGGCPKRFVQLHQMKKHAKTPHAGASTAPSRKRVKPPAIVGAAPAGAGAARPRRVSRDGSSDDAINVKAGDETPAKRRSRGSAAGAAGGPGPDEGAVDAVGGGAAAEAEASGWQREGRRNRGVLSEEEADAVDALVRVEEEERPVTPLDAPVDRSMVVSPTSLLLSNTKWQQAGGRTSLWSPPGFSLGSLSSFLGDDLRSLPVLPTLLDEAPGFNPPTPIPFAFGPSPPVELGAFVPIAGSAVRPIAVPATVAPLAAAVAPGPAAAADGSPQFPSRPAPSPLPVEPLLYK